MSDPKQPNQDGRRPEPKPARKLPDAAICQARRAGFGDYVDCLVDHPYECHYAGAFGFGWFCHNPESAAIIARTEARTQEGLG